jgi:predicted small lipoprotein YifL
MTARRRIVSAQTWVVCLLIAASFLACAVGCGLKGPPVAPQIPAPAAVSDLAARVDKGRVTLAWRVPEAVDAAPPEGFRIYRADLGPADCADCPLLFAKIGEVRLDPQQRPAPETPWRLSWQDTPASGRRYVYKVSAYGRGRETVDSNLVGVQP